VGTGGVILGGDLRVVSRLVGRLIGCADLFCSPIKGRVDRQYKETKQGTLVGRAGTQSMAEYEAGALRT
jgi:hypothetical protein